MANKKDKILKQLEQVQEVYSLCIASPNAFVNSLAFNCSQEMKRLIDDLDGKPNKETPKYKVSYFDEVDGDRGTTIVTEADGFSTIVDLVADEYYITDIQEV